MHTYIVLFTLITLFSVAVIGGSQEILNVAKFISNIHQELPNSCVFIINSEGKKKGKKNFELISHKWCVFGQEIRPGL
jgi:hypothetical protein